MSHEDADGTSADRGRPDGIDVAVIGGGNMGTALVLGMLRADDARTGAIAVVEAAADRRVELVELFGDRVEVLDRVPPARSAVIAVKPQHVASAAAAAGTAGVGRVLSVAAGVSTASIAAATGPGVAVVRTMPNTPALVGEGVVAVCAGSTATDDDLAWAESLLDPVGLVVRVDESQIDAVTGLTGSGPAYVFLLAEALIAAGSDVGLPPEQVGPMVAQLLVGSARMVAEFGDPADLRAKVTSPGGTTAEGIAVLEARDLRGAVAAAVAAATRRSAELGAPAEADGSGPPG